MKKILLALLGLFGIAYGQTIGYLRYDSVKMAKPGGYTELILENSTKGVTGGVLTNLGNGRTGFVASSGTGTVTNFSSGSLSPLFTSSVANSTTAPALSFTLSSTSQYKLFGRKASGSGVPSFIDADSSVIIDLHSEGYYNTKYLNLTTPFNKLTAATGSTSLDNGNTVQTWKWDTHTGTFPGLIISSASTARNNTNAALLGVTISGANASANGYTTGAAISVANTGTTSINTALKLSASGATTNYGLLVTAGNVGIGTGTPDSILHIVGGLKYANGSQGVGKVLTSDANGGASWQTASGSGSSSLTNLLNINQVPHSGIVVNQDSVIIFGDSYVVGTGATSAAKGWAPVLSSYMNAILDNRGVDGTTLEKRTPVNWVGGAATNMIDLLTTVPVKTAKKKLLIIALALNDWGYNGGQYNPVNYKTDYDSVMNYITNTKGWPAKNVLIIPPYWIGAAGRTQYAGLSGNAAPTYAQALVFIDSTKAVANQWGTLYFDIYHDQYNNDTTLFNGGNPIHPDDSGFLYIARDIYTYLAPNIQLWKQNTTNEVMPYFATNTPASTTTPASINLGASYASSAGSPGISKLKLYYDGTANNTVGFGVSTAGLESNVFPGGTFDYYVGAYKIASFGVGNADIRTAVQFSGYGAGAATFDASGNITSVSDMRLKNLQGYYHGGLTELMNITPIIYKWKPGSGMETNHDYIGFSAQNIKSVLGEGAYGVNSKGYLSIQDRAIMATMVNAIQELQKEVNDLKQQIKNK